MTDDFKSFADAEIYIDEDYMQNMLNIKYIPKYPLISEIIGTELDSDPGFLFEDIDELDKALLADHEKDIKFNKAYILDFWEELESLPLRTEWDIRYDKKELKCWTAKNGSKFDRSNICVRVEAYFDKKYEFKIFILYRYSFETVVRTISDISNRKKWDSNLDKANLVYRIARNSAVIRAQSAKLPVLSIRE